MADQNVGIKNSWGLIAFARMKGKMRVAPFVNKETGEAFKSCMFTTQDAEGKDVHTIVNFSSNLGELTPAEIIAQKNDLQVVELENGRFKLCKSGSTWESVDLGL